MKTVRLFPLYLLVSLFLSSCCCDEYHHEYRIEGITSIDHIDNSDAYFQFVDAGSEIPATAYGIRIKLNSPLKRVWQEDDCSDGCEDHYHYFTNKIDSVELITLNDYDSSHVAGSDVSGYAKYAIPDNFNDVNWPKAKDYYNTGTSFIKKDIFMLLYTPTEYPGMHQFAFNIYLRDTVYSDTTTLVQLTSAQ